MYLTVCKSRQLLGGQGETPTARVEIKGDYSERLSYKEKLEFERLEKELPSLEARRTALEADLMQESDHQKMQAMGEELGKLSAQIDEAEMRWLELSERA